MRKFILGLAATLLALLGLVIPVMAQAASPPKPLLARLVNGPGRTSHDFASGAKSQTFTLTGNSGLCTAPWTLSPGQCSGISYNFGLGPQTEPGNTYSCTFTGTGSQTFTLTNHGTTATSLTSLGWYIARQGVAPFVMTPSDPYQVCGDVQFVQPGRSCQVTITYTEPSRPPRPCDAASLIFDSGNRHSRPMILASLVLLGPGIQ